MRTKLQGIKLTEPEAACPKLTQPNSRHTTLATRSPASLRLSSRHRHKVQFQMKAINGIHRGCQYAYSLTAGE